MEQLRPVRCERNDAVPPDADVLLTIGTATVAAHGAVLAARSAYFGALLAWPTAAPAAAPAAVSRATGDDGADGGPSPGERVAGTPTGAAPTWVAAVRRVTLHDVDPGAAMLALHGLYGLPYDEGGWEDLAAAHELLDAWQATTETCACLLRRLRDCPPGDRAALFALAWEVDPRPLSDPLRRAVQEIARTDPIPVADEVWARVSAPVAARFLGHLVLRASEDEVLELALRWARAAPRSDADVAAVSGSVRYGAVGVPRVLSLWEDPGVPAAMRADAGRLFSYLACRDRRDAHGDTGVAASCDVLVRYVPRRIAAAETYAADGAWRWACGAKGHRACYCVLLSNFRRECHFADHTPSTRVSIRTSYLDVYIKIHPSSTSDGYLVSMAAGPVWKPVAVVVDSLCTPWGRAFFPANDGRRHYRGIYNADRCFVKRDNRLACLSVHLADPDVLTQ